MRRLLPRTVLALVLVATAVSVARAHELWLEPAEGGRALLLHWGHAPHAGGHGGEASLPYDPGAVVDVVVFGADGQVFESEADTGSAWPVQIGAADGLVAVRFDGGTWTRTVRGTRAGGPDRHPEGLESWSSWASIKRLHAWNAAFAAPVLAGIEITPATDPFALRADDKLDVRVTIGGAPVEGAVVSYQGKPRGSSGPDGVVRLRLRETGIQRITATYEEQRSGAVIGRILHESFLEFVLEKR